MFSKISKFLYSCLNVLNFFLFIHKISRRLYISLSIFTCLGRKHVLIFDKISKIFFMLINIQFITFLRSWDIKDICFGAFPDNDAFFPVKCIVLIPLPNASKMWKPSKSCYATEPVSSWLFQVSTSHRDFFLLGMWNWVSKMQFSLFWWLIASMHVSVPVVIAQLHVASWCPHGSYLGNSGNKT